MGPVTGISDKMTEPPWPPLGGTENPGTQQKPLYSEQLKTRIQRSERLNRNVLEINLESERRAEDIDDNVIATLFNNVGIDRSRHEIEGMQMVPKRMPRKIYVWFKDGVDLLQFCKGECYRLKPGVKTGTIKPMDRREVEVTIRGLNLNTPDTMVMEYLTLFGRLVKNVVVYDTIKEGPFSGLKNGDRRFMMDFTGGKNMGSYHPVDGINVHVSYPGQRRTCARCHRTATTCPGSGLAQACENNGGNKVSLKDHMQALWEEIGFKPAEFKVEGENNDSEEVEIRENQGFTPLHKARPETSEDVKERITGFSVRNLPADISEDQVKSFLQNLGLPATHEKIVINQMRHSSTVDVEELTTQTCTEIMNKLQGDTTAFDRTIYCKGIADLVASLENEEIVETGIGTTQTGPIETGLEQTTIQKPATTPGSTSPSSRSPKGSTQHQVIPGLNMSVNQQKKQKYKAAKKKLSKEDRDAENEVLDHNPLFKSQQERNEKKRKADLAALSPQDNKGGAKVRTTQA